LWLPRQCGSSRFADHRSSGQPVVCHGEPSCGCRCELRWKDRVGAGAKPHGSALCQRCGLIRWLLHSPPSPPSVFSTCGCCRCCTNSTQGS
jgi:hypothetical protein